MKALEMIDVTKQFAGTHTPAVDSVSLCVNEGEFITILGTSGCGKTTLLKMINRLFEPSSGIISLFGEDISTVEKVTVRRRIGYVIQQVGLFPHMTIADNIATVPRLLKWEKSVIDRRIDELLDLIGLNPSEYKSRFPSQLSGGQQQRVGLARALAADPKIMLLDEPFGAIDAITRTHLQDELLRLHQGMQKTFLFVTHDINEAFKLGDRVLIMHNGHICQFDTPRNIALNPTDPFTASLIASARAQEQFWEELT